MDPLALGLDVGTSSAKCVLADAGGTVLWHDTCPIGVQRPRPDFAEQDPEEWWTAAAGAVRRVLAAHPGAEKRIEAVGVCGQGVGAAFLDHAGKPLRSAIIWLDSRSAPQARKLAEEHGKRITEISGKAPASYTFEPKLLWVRENEPEVWAATRSAMTTTAYVTFRFTGERVMNHSDGGFLLGYDLRRRRWSDETLGLMGLPESIYCPLAPCREVIGKVTSEASAATGLRPGIPVVAGGEDTSAAGLAVGAIAPGDALLSMGTAGTVNILQRDPPTDARLLAFPHVVENLTFLGGSMVAGGASLGWIANLIAGTPLGSEPSVETINALCAEAASLEPGESNLVFLPYLAGEMQPINDGMARGAFFGLSFATSRGHLTRAVLEGTAFAVESNLEIMRSLGAAPRRLIAIGRPVGNPLFMQIVSDIAGIPITTMKEDCGSALGSAILAAVGSGNAGSFEQMSQAHAVVTGQYSPSADARRGYLPLYGIFKELYPRLKEVYPLLREHVASSAFGVGA